MATALSALMIIAWNLKYVHSLDIPAEEGGESPRRGSPVRLAVWCLLLLPLCILITTVPESDGTVIGFWLEVRDISVALVFGLAIGLATYPLIYLKAFTSPSSERLALAIIISLYWLVVGFKELLAHGTDIKLAVCSNPDQGAVLTLALNYPRTGAKVTDLDQVSAIIVAVLAAVFTAWGGGSKVRKWWRGTTRS